MGHGILGVTLGLLICAAAAAHEPGPPLHLASVNGNGEASGRPDRARLWLAVEKLDPDLKKAQDEVDRIVRAYSAESAPRPMAYMARAAAAPESGNGQMGISTGEIRVEAAITADFDLLPP